ncbi:MAG: hypothetical protein C5B59_14875 [Bacteroidetes bacterium]|nr:MAG: hypothetical protein C5B59_14875 [Bacteroidota bacterium]
MRKLLYLAFLSTGFLSSAFSQSSVAPFKDFNQYSTSAFMHGGVLMSFNNKENTKGKRYYYDGWVKGTLIGEKGRIISNDKYLFNLDKIDGNLLVTEDKSNIIQVDKSEIRYFTLVNGSDSTSFERVDLIDPKVYLRIITKKGSAPGYTLYKTIRTSFVKANYVTDGLMESGNQYDEYVDAEQYFVVLPDGKEFRPIQSLKPKAIRAAFKGEEKRLNEYFDQHSDQPIDEFFLKGLTDYINK